MSRVKLIFKGIAQIVGASGLSVIVLTDVDEQQQLSVVCDKAMTDQFSQRLALSPRQQQQLLPEVLVSMLLSEGDISDYELMVYDVSEGQYRVSLLNKLTLTLRPIRMSDAVLLSLIADIPLYIDQALMARQSSLYKPESPGIHIPINTLETKRLNEELEKAISEENYRLASFIHKEIQRREKK